jgi:hypothetical protein
VRESDIFTLLCGSKKEDYIKKKSMVSIRYGLQKHFLKIRDFDIVNRPENTLFWSLTGVCKSKDS